jgi:hypothetical protein
VQASVVLQIVPEVLPAASAPQGWELWRYHVATATWSFTGFALTQLGHCVGTLRTMRVLAMEEGWGRVYQCRPHIEGTNQAPLGRW